MNAWEWPNVGDTDGSPVQMIMADGEVMQYRVGFYQDWMERGSVLLPPEAFQIARQAIKDVTRLRIDLETERMKNRHIPRLVENDRLKYEIRQLEEKVCTLKRKT